METARLGSQRDGGTDSEADTHVTLDPLPNVVAVATYNRPLLGAAGERK
jgi:hypothetical protein